MSNAPDLPRTVQCEFNDLMLGEKLGQGEFREVYEFRPDPSLVVKLELTDTKRFSNVHEWVIWNEVEDNPKLAKWFAPCKWISHSGSVLIQKRTEPIRRLPTMVPNLMADAKVENWGPYNGKPVMHDYGNHSFFEQATKRFRLVKRK